MNTSSKLLINESPLTVLPSLVCLVGLERAILLQQIQYLLQQKNTGKILDDGEKYIWNTAQEFHDNCFPFWEPDTIRKHLKKLETDGYLIACKPLAASRNHTKFYRVDYVTLNQKLGGESPSQSPEISDEIPAVESDAVNDLDAASYSESNRKIIRIEPEDNAASESEYNAGSLKETKTSTKTSGGGGGSCNSERETGNKNQPPTAAAESPPGISNPESRTEYLLRKQIEFPHFNVEQIYEDFRRKCGSVKYPKLKDSRRTFDKWLAEQDVEFESEKQKSEPFDEAAFFAKKYGGKTNAV